MTDDERGSDVADRMSRRFESDERDDRSERSQSGQSDERDDRSETSQNVQNVKKEWDGWYLYLPDELGELLDAEFDRLVYECGLELDWKPKKNRHYYPVVIDVGIRAVAEMDAKEFYEYAEKLNLDT